MIRTPPQHNTTNPPGQVDFEKPLGKSIEEYKALEYAKRIHDAYTSGYEHGYGDGEVAKRYEDYQQGYNNGYADGLVTAKANKLAQNLDSEASR